MVEPEPIDGSVFPLAVRRIVIDPGHGGGNLGTRIPGGLEEKFITLDIGRKVAADLRERGFEVLLTRDQDTGITLEERAALANREHADIFVSVHVNWLEGSRDSGIETYFLGATDDPFLTSLAARENRDSGHTMAELRQILDGIYAGVRYDKSQDLAEAIHRSMVELAPAGQPGAARPRSQDRSVPGPGRHPDAGRPGGGGRSLEPGRGGDAGEAPLPGLHRRLPGSRHPLLRRILGRPAERTVDKTTPSDDPAEAVSTERLARSEAP